MNWVTVARVGLSDNNGAAPIYASCGQGDAQDEHYGLGSLYGATVEATPLQTIEVATLDSYLEQHSTPRPDIIKIDIEGAELPCLKGAERTLRHHQPLLIVEVQEQSSTAAGYRQTDILDYLSRLGYTFESIGHNGQLHPMDTGHVTVYQNVLCTPARGDSRPSESTT
jgi:FkbM family methyltransferase